MDVSRRRGTTALAALVIVAAGGGAAAFFGAQDARPIPPGRADVRSLYERRVDVEMRGDLPEAELVPTAGARDARAVAVAFHAVLGGTTRRYRLDYEGFHRDGDTWRVRFVQFPKPSRLLDRLFELEVAVTTKLVGLETRRWELRRTSERLRGQLQTSGGKRARATRDKLAELQRQRRRLKREMRLPVRRVEAIEDDQRAAASEQPSYPIEVKVVERDGALMVERVGTDSPDAARLAKTIGYAEPAAEVDVWGSDYFDARFRRRGRSNGNVSIEVRTFWTGPLGARYEEACRGRVVDGSGEVAHAEAKIPRSPLIDAPYVDAPPDEDSRDGGIISFGFAYDGDVDELELRMVCDWRPRQ